MGDLKTFIAILAVSMVIIGTMMPALAVSPKAYSFEDNLEIDLLDASDEQLYVPGEILVKFNPGVSEAKIKDINSKNGATVTATSAYTGLKKMNIPKTKSVEEMVEIYSKNPNVEYATANYVMHEAYVPNDPRYSEQWNFHSTYGINVTEAWDISNGTGVVVAVLDGGVAYEAPDLNITNFVDGYNCFDNTMPPIDDNGHGTHVIGTIAQSTNNSIGVTGVAFNCSIMPVKVLKNGRGDQFVLAEGIRHAADNGAKVISMSLSFGTSTTETDILPVIEALDYASGKGVTIVAAAGNDGLETVCYPAAYEECIAVGATGYDGETAYYSNYGSAIDVMAPGGELYRYPGNIIDGYGILQNTFNKDGVFDYYKYQGTSMATPHVSGVAALLIANGVTDPDDLRTAIEESATRKLIVDAYAALTYNVGDIDEPLVADFTYTANELTVQFTDTSSSNEEITRWEWEFGDGEVNDTQNPVHTYASGSTYSVNLTVYEADDDNSTVTKEVIVTENQEPSSINVAIIDMGNMTRIAGKNTFVVGTATIEVTNGTGPIGNATVHGQWSNATSDSETVTTISDGTVTVTSDEKKYKTEQVTYYFTFTVDYVMVEGLEYTAGIHFEEVNDTYIYSA